MIHLHFIIPCSIGIISEKGNDISDGRIIKQDFPHHLVILCSHMKMFIIENHLPPQTIKLQIRLESRRLKF